MYGENSQTLWPQEVLMRKLTTPFTRASRRACSGVWYTGGSLGTEGPGLSLSVGAGETVATGSLCSCSGSGSGLISTKAAPSGVGGLIVCFSVLCRMTTLILWAESVWPDSGVGGVITELAWFSTWALDEESMWGGSEFLTGNGGLCKAYSLDVEGTESGSVVKTPMAWFPNVECAVATEGWWECAVVGSRLDPDAWFGKVLAPHFAAGRMSSRWGKGCDCQININVRTGANVYNTIYGQLHQLPPRCSLHLPHHHPWPQQGCSVRTWLVRHRSQTIWLCTSSS